MVDISIYDSVAVVVDISLVSVVVDISIYDSVAVVLTLRLSFGKALYFLA